ncbi:acyl carrier protein [Micromonospora sp. NPDC005215]|uniref:acyl carrier protein n=1 Tax=Micromonospora sp. NPDC005215 TaxID=3157024 RepID=UPI0033A02EBC
MTAAASLDRQGVIEILAEYHQRPADEEDADAIDSLELAWLIHQVEQRYGVELDLPDETLLQMSTVDRAARLLRQSLDGQSR